MTQSPTIKAITFDVGNVLVRWDPRLAYEPLFHGRDEELNYFLNNICTLAWHTNHDQGISFADNILSLQKKFPEHTTMIGLFEDQWDNMFGGIIEDSVELLYLLKEHNYTLFALTNFPADKFSDFREQNHFMNLFHDIIVSGEEKITKPDPRIYQILLQRTDIAAHETLFIDDRMENLVAAQKFGLQTHLFTTAKKLKSELQLRGILPAA
ncbi:MAG: HAD family phosphatase [Emcibacter sp.]|nr:HAD family phosphatase [Emcibacter sp.]